LEANLRRHSRNFTLSPETTDYDSNCGDLDSLSNDINCPTDYGKLYTSMPVLEDGLSSGHASDTENNVSVVCDKQQSSQSQPVHEHNGNGERLENDYNVMSASMATLTTDDTITLGGPRKRPPGFPQRVSPTTSSAGNNATASAKASVGNLIDLIDHEEERSGALREKTPTFDYLYEFSETRKVLEEFFKANPEDEKRYTDYTTESGDDVASSVSTSYTSHTQMDCKVYLPFLFASSNRSTQLRPWSRHISASGWREYPKKSSTWCTARPLRSQ